MKIRTKTLLVALCAVLLVAASVLGTMAYLTDSEAVTNTFTVGQVGLSLDETDTDGSKTDVTTEGRDKANAYKLIPGQTYAKDPTVHVDAASEDSWIFVKVVNGIADIEADTNTIHAQIIANGWTELTAGSGVYYRAYDKDADPQVRDFVVFEEFTIDGDSVDGTKLANYNGATVTVTAYAIQMAGFEGEPADAWETANLT